MFGTGSDVATSGRGTTASVRVAVVTRPAPSSARSSTRKNPVVLTSGTLTTAATSTRRWPGTT